MSIANDHARLTRRLQRFLLCVAALGLIAAQIYGGWRCSAGFLLGAIASWWNFRNLHNIVNALGTANSTGGLGAAAWILFRFIVLVLGAFVMLRFTQISVYAAFTGLFVSVGAVILEAIFELTYER
ncbi:MAG: synthase subunit [Bryobacterales bacterium]|nr:synthase subunit [Bryobacterales bacterium]